jgi:hypothetical protein
VLRRCHRDEFDAAAEWKNARRTQPLQAVHATLKRMMGERERCMYCRDSHGTDIDRFWPKTPYPERMFVWLNLLLCCAGCRRIKGDRFPVAGDQPLLVDPTAEDPWRHLEPKMALTPGAGLRRIGPGFGQPAVGARFRAWRV